MSATTIHHAGTLGGPDGEISVSFVPEYNTIFMHASVPSDKRRASISIHLTDTASLRRIVDKLEALIQAEVERRTTAISPKSSAIQESDDSVSIAVSGGAISIPRLLYKEVATLVADGKTLVAASVLSKSIAWIGLVGARQIAQAIYEDQRDNGLRE